jgi:predicted permease
MAKRLLKEGGDTVVFIAIQRQSMLQDLRYALRQLGKSPVFAVVTVLTIALAIGANTAIFSVVNAVLLRSLPYAESDRLVVLLHSGKDPVAAANYLDWREQNHVFSGMGAAEGWTPNLSATRQAESIHGLHVSSNLFPMLGVQPLLGRFFLPEEERKGKDHAVILSYPLWQRMFGGDPGIVGQSVTLQGERYTVVGVMPRQFQFAPFWATKAEIYAPLSLEERATSRGGNSLRVFARLKPDVKLDDARAEITTITTRLEQQFPGTNRDVTVEFLKEKVVGDTRPALLILLAAVTFVLLIACANVAHLLLARGAARQREMAVRAALGAERWRIARQFLAESLVLAIAGAVAGLALAYFGIGALKALLPASIPRVQTIAIDGHVLLFTAAVSLVAGIIFGLVPAMQARDVNLRDALQEGGRGGGDSLRRSRIRGALVASEFALALLLMVGAGLMIRTFLALRAIDPGFQPHHLVSAVVSVAGSEQAAPQRRAAFYEQLVQRTGTLPNVESASGINHLPLAGDLWGQNFKIEGRPLPAPGESPNAVYRVMLPGYFRTMGMTLLRGRDILASDNLKAPAVAVVNRRLAELYWPGENPIGKRITLDDPAKNPVWVSVVGVAQDAKQDDWAREPWPELYVPLLQSPKYLEDPAGHYSYLTLVARTQGDPQNAMNEIRSLIGGLDRNVAVSEVQTMDQVVDDANAQPRFELWLLASFSGVAVLLAALGIYGVMSYSVSRRTRELGLRMALGANRRDVVGLVVRQAMILAAIGLSFGLGLSLALTRLMEGILYGVEPNDPLTLLGVTATIVVVALVASYLPARRATHVDPVTALRCD